MKRFCVIDGQGGGIGAVLIKYIKEAYGESIRETTQILNFLSPDELRKLFVVNPRKLYKL